MRNGCLTILAVVLALAGGSVPILSAGAPASTAESPAQTRPAGSGQDWPQWRGPTRDGLVAGPAWPASLGEDHLKQIWRVELGPSYSGPIVAGDRVFVTETRDRKEEVVRALDRQTGRELWTASWDGALSVAFMAKRNGDWIRSTPAWDGESLFVAGMRDVLVCLDGRTGKERWRIDFVEKYHTLMPPFGFVCSPLVVGDHVYVQAGGGFCKIDKKNGQVVWRVLEDEGGMYGSAFSSPLPARVAGVEQIIVQTRKKIAGVLPETGRVLWSQEVPATLGMNILTPMLQGDRLFTSAYGAGSYLFEVSRAGEGFQVRTVWQKPTQGYMTTPVILGGHAYMHLRNRTFVCLDLATGEQKWATKPYGEYWSLVAQGQMILALDQRGDLLLIRANPEKFELLDSRKISTQETWGHLSVCGGQLFVRELKAIAAYSWK